MQALGDLEVVQRPAGENGRASVLTTDALSWRPMFDVPIQQ
jgi:hypothetical protein